MTEKEMIENYFKKRLLTNPRTQYTYTMSIRQFFNVIKKDMTTYFENKPNYEADIETYYLYLQKNGCVLTTKSCINTIKLFFYVYDKETKTLDIWDTLSSRLRGANKESEETALERGDIKKILEYSDESGRAIFLVLASSGCRVRELTLLELDDIKLNENPVRIHFRGETTKNGKQRDTFITPEAKESLLKWLEVRKKYLSSNRGCYTVRDKNDNRVFPMTVNNIEYKWKMLVKKAGFDSRDRKTRRLKSHIHSLRKFFRSNFGNVDLAEHLIGHSGYLSTYRQHSTKQLAEEYTKNMKNVTIFESTDLQETNKEIEALKRQLEKKDREFEKFKIDVALRLNGIVSGA